MGRAWVKAAYLQFYLKIRKKKQTYHEIKSFSFLVVQKWGVCNPDVHSAHAIKIFLQKSECCCIISYQR